VTTARDATIEVVERSPPVSHRDVMPGLDDYPRRCSRIRGRAIRIAGRSFRRHAHEHDHSEGWHDGRHR